MPVETLFAPATLLWMVVSAIAVAILLGSINRRRSRLTQALRDHVDRHQRIGSGSSSKRDQTDDD